MNRKKAFLALGIWCLLLLITMFYTAENASAVELISSPAYGEAFVLEQNTTVTQPFYAYTDFHDICLRRAVVTEEDVVEMILRREGQNAPVWQRRVTAAADEAFFTASGDGVVLPAGNYTLSVRNSSDRPVTLVRSDGRRYDEAYLTPGAESKLSLSLYRHTGTVISVCILAGMVFLAGVLFLYLTKDSWKTHPDRFVFRALLFLGISTILLVPVWHTYDFNSHFTTAWYKSGRLLGIQEGSDYRLVLRKGDIRTLEYICNDRVQTFYGPTKRSIMDWADNVFAACADVSPDDSGADGIYFMAPRASDMTFSSGWNYIPFIIVFTLLRYTPIGLTGLLTIGRLLSLLLLSAGMAHAVRMMPLMRGKWLMSSFVLFPMCVLNMTQLTYDGMVLVAVCNLLSVIVSLRFNKTGSPGLSRFSTLFPICLLLGALKGGGHALMVLLATMLFTRPVFRKKNLIPVSAMVCALLSLLLFNVLLHPSQESGYYQFQENAGNWSVRYALSHPGRYFASLLYTYFVSGDYLIHSMAGGNAQAAPFWVTAGLIAAVLLITYGAGDTLAVPEESEAHVTWTLRDRISLLLPPVLLLVGIPLTVFYLTPLTSMHLNGLQGRYLLPVVLPVLFCFTAAKGKDTPTPEKAPVPGPLQITGFALMIAMYAATYYFVTHAFVFT